MPVAPSETARPVDPALNLGAAGWFRLVMDTPDQDSLAGFDLEVGTLDGRLARTYTAAFGPLAPAAAMEGALPVAIGPYGDDVLFAFWDGHRSELRAISVTSGQDRLLLQRDDIVHALAFDRATESIYLLTLDPETRRETSIVKVPRNSPNQEEAIPLPGAGPRAGEQIWTRLWVTPDGSRLLVLACPSTCSATALALRGVAPMTDWDLGGGDVVGVTNDAIVTVFDCAPPCSATRYDISSGDAGPIGAFCEAGVIASVQGRPALVSDWPTRNGCRDVIYNIGRTDIANGDREGIVQRPDRKRAIVPLDATQGAAVPEGWFLIGPGGELVGTGADRLLPPLLVNAEDGSVLELLPLGPPRQP